MQLVITTFKICSLEKDDYQRVQQLFTYDSKLQRK